MHAIQFSYLHSSPKSLLLFGSLQVANILHVLPWSYLGRVVGFCPNIFLVYISVILLTLVVYRKYSVYNVNQYLMHVN
jgi:hypothetical protein